MSREHAALYPTAGHLNVADCQSKYGVYVNSGIETNRAIDKDKRTELTAGHIVRFGRFQSIWRVEHIDWSFVPSTLTDDEKEAIQLPIKCLDVQYSEEWVDSCTHLVMTDVTITVKVLLALAKGIPIVMPEFLHETIAAIQENRPIMPNEVDFVPKINEPYLVQEKSLLAVNLDRCRLFAGKIFYFMLQKHQKQFEAVINMAGGTCKNLEKHKIRKSLLVNSDAILVNYEANSFSQTSQCIDSVAQYVAARDRRIIGEPEIGLAIFHCSTKQFCNPEHKLENNLKMPENSSFDKVGQLLIADETPQAPVASQPYVETVEVAESITIDDEADHNCNQANDENQAQQADSSVPITDSNVSFEPRSSRSSARRSKENQNLVSSPAKPISRSATNGNKRKGTDISPASPKRTKQTRASKVSDQLEFFVPQPVTLQVQCLEVTAGPSKAAAEPRAVSHCDPSSAELFPISPAPPTSQASSIFGQDTQPFVPITSASGFLSAHSSSILRRREDNTPNSTPTKPVANKKRPFDCLNDDNDDGADLFQFETKSMSKKSKRDRGGRNEPANNQGDDDLFNFGDVSTSSGRGSQRQRKKQNEGEPSVQQHTHQEVQPNNISVIKRREAEIAKKALYLSPIRASNNVGWLCKKFRNDIKFSGDNAASVQIKEEPLSDSQLTREERNRRWEKSLENAIIVQTLDMSFFKPMVSDAADNVDGNGSNISNGPRNFKKFVKVRWRLNFFSLPC